MTNKISKYFCRKRCAAHTMRWMGGQMMLEQVGKGCLNGQWKVKDTTSASSRSLYSRKGPCSIIRLHKVCQARKNFYFWVQKPKNRLSSMLQGWGERWIALFRIKGSSYRKRCGTVPQILGTPVPQTFPTPLTDVCSQMTAARPNKPPQTQNKAAYLNRKWKSANSLTPYCKVSIQQGSNIWTLESAKDQN